MEFVYVVKRGDLFPEGAAVRGFLALSAPVLESRFLEPIRRDGFFLERARAERDPEFKQVIPYAVVLGGEDILCFRRTEAQSEARLRRKWSIGVGGHVNPEDAGADPVRAGCLREIAEELAIASAFEVEAVGVLNDDSNDVGSVHFGVVHVVRAPRGAVAVREIESMEGRFASPSRLREELRRGEDFETWSAILLEDGDRLLACGTEAG